MSLFRLDGRSDPYRIALVKRWVKEQFSLSEEATILASELRCGDPGCPPHETVIVIVDREAKARQYKIAKPMAMVREVDVAALVPPPISA